MVTAVDVLTAVLLVVAVVGLLVLVGMLLFDVLRPSEWDSVEEHEEMVRALDPPRRHAAHRPR